ncbi:hypothetical protein VitviT2T_004115 [Vitis vinifera]|uniref:Uncharacterized protein n=2 Tax=Vitis vinifera TaxID=29760 RepID=A0ABY9BQG3_VITVI|eukprot:XP_002266756.1 PREDICTED: uncharacterized protein LOC100265791 [Vitis vinifera]
MPSGSSSSNKLRSMIELLYLYRSCSGNPSHVHGSNLPVAKLRSGYSIHKGLRSISANSSGFCRASHTNMAKDGKEKVQPATVPAASAWSIFPSWAKVLAGSILSLLLPFLKWDKLMRLEGEAEIVVAEVEKVATVTEKVSGDVANILPDKSKLKDAALLVEHISKVTAEDAELTEHFIQKVDVLKQDVQDLERMVEPIIHNISEKESSGT